MVFGAMIGNLLPIWFPFLLAALPGMMAAAHVVNNTIFASEDRSTLTLPAVALALALLPAHILALAFASLSAGLAITWITIGLAGYAWFALHWRNVCQTACTADGDRLNKFAIVLLATLPVIPLTILLNFHDEQHLGGHLSMIAQLQNGAYPPRYLYEPELPLRYHYAFDLGAAIITGLLRVRPDQAIDIFTIILWPTTFLLVWRLGEHFGGRKTGLFVAVTVCFAGNWPLLCTGDETSTGSLLSIIAQRSTGNCSVGGELINPPFISYFFQHPWSLGVPLFALIVLQRAAIARLRFRMAGLAAMIATLSLLSLSQLVLFITVVVGIGVTETWTLVWYRSRTSAEMLLVLVLSLFGAKLLGGFFSSGDYPAASGLFDTPFALRSIPDLNALLLQVQWNAATFGILLILGIPGMLWIRNDRFFLVALATIAFTTLNLFRYSYTWDIVKFATVCSIALAISSGVLLAEMWQRAQTHLQRLVHFSLAFGTIVQGLVFPAIVLLWPIYRAPMIRPYFSQSFPVEPDEADAIEFLRTHMKQTDILYCTGARTIPYAIWAGLPTQNNYYSSPGSGEDSYGLGVEKMQRRISLSKVTPDWLKRLSGEGVNWIVAGPEDTEINDFLNRIEINREVVFAGQFGQVRIFRVP